MKEWLLGLVLGVGALMIVAQLFFDHRKRRPYRVDKDNPMRRWCVKCGQLQTFRVSSTDGWWIAQGPERSPQCACHDDTDWMA